MVFQSRMDCRSSGYQGPVVPHCPRSARGKRSARKKAGNRQMRAIDLLANLASKLLSERENLPTPCFHDRASSPVGVDMTVELESIGRQKSLKSEAYDELSCNEDEHCPENFNKRKKTIDLSNHSKASPATEISCEDTISAESKFVGENCKIVNGFDVIQKCGTKMLDSITIESHGLDEVRSKTAFRAEEKMERDAKIGKDLHMSCANSPINLNGNYSALVSSDNIHHKVCFSKQEDDMDPSPDKDSENSSECTPSVITNVEGKTDLSGKRMDCTRQRTQMCSFVKRKFFEHYSASTSDGGIFCEANDTWSSTKTMKSCNSSPDYHAANDAWSSTKVIKSCNSSPDYHGFDCVTFVTITSVKLRIKSFEVPELVVEIPETTTVGSLKRTVLEAVNTMLGGGLQLGVLLQGKRVTDDSKTLHQVGISHSEKLDGLCFTLEPNTKHVPEKLTCPRDPHLLSLGSATGSPDGSLPAAPSATNQLGSDATQKCVKSFRENDHDSVLSSTNASSPEKQISSSLVLVAAPPPPPPPVNAEALAMVPFRSKPKSKSCQVAQRRVRRPFSVAEVEALVQAVEKLGTGRWRDVKLCAFENEKHRTYVDLKDKWKTLVHTARISPQQRRGEPVPQGLLDRVLLAQAYWSQQQSKLQAKSLPATETLLLLS